MSTTPDPGRVEGTDDRDVFARVLAAYPDVVHCLRARHVPGAGGRCAGCAAPYPCVHIDIAGRAARHATTRAGATAPAPAAGHQRAELVAALVELLTVFAGDVDELAGRIETGRAQPLEVATRLRLLARSARGVGGTR